MKFSEMPYVRPNLEEIKASFGRILERIEAAGSAQEQIDAYMDCERESKAINTACTLAHVRHTIDTKDEFYDKENDYVDEVPPFRS